MMELNSNNIKRIVVILVIVTSINATLTFRDNMDQPNIQNDEKNEYLRLQTGLSISTVFLGDFTSNIKYLVRNIYDYDQITSCDTDYVEISYLEETNSTLILIALPSLIASLGVVSKKQKWIGDNSSVKEQLYNTIDYNPGLHFRELCRFLNRQNGVIQYHLWILETREGRITSYQDGGYTRYFVGSIENTNDLYLQLYSAFRRSSMKKVLCLIHSSSDGISRQVLAGELGVSPQCISRICKKLLLANIIDESLVNRQKLYSMTKNAVSVFEKTISKID